MEALQECLYAEIESFKSQQKALSTENIQLRAKSQDLEKQIDFANEKLQKKEKEMNKLVFELEMTCKTEEEVKKLLEESRKKNEILIKEVNDLKLLTENFRLEKREANRDLKEFELKIEKLQKTLAFKEDTIAELLSNLSNLEKEVNLASKKNIKAQTNKLNIKKLDLFQKRGISESPDRKNLQLTGRGDESSLKGILYDAMKIVNAETSKDFLDKICYLRQSCSDYKKMKKLFDKISQMIIQFSPSGSFNKEPSIHQIWKWFKILLEEYMRLKQSTSGENFNKLCYLLGTDSIEGIIEKVAILQNSRSRGTLKNL